MTAASVLIVDDIEANRETVRALLDAEGYQLLEAADGATALRMAAETPPDLVLLDVMMPGMDGFEVCRRLRADARLAEVPVIMLTALDDQASRLQGIEAGADDFVSKPFNRAELRARIRTITRLNRYRRLHQATERIREQAELISLAPDAIFVCDLDGRITYWNPAAERLYGWSAAEAIGQRAAELLANGADEDGGTAALRGRS
jgi:DNA-binding response OmpR family regulator